MFASEINIFIRRAFVLEKVPYNKLVKNADSRLFYVLSGNGEIIIENKSYTVSNDTLIILKSGTSYQWKLNKENDTKLSIINFDYTQEFSGYPKLLGLIPQSMFNIGKVFECGNFDDIKVLNSPVVLNNMTVFKKEVSEIISEFEDKKVYYSEYISSALRNIILKVSRYVSSAMSDEKSKIEPILEYIQSNFDKDITNTQLAKMTNYHPHYINSLMKQYTGTTLHAYLTEYRLNEALKLLVNTDCSIDQISSKVGYKNPTHFCNVFRKKFGISPSKHRNLSKII